MASKFGRVDAENNVFVIEDAGERRVGQYPNVSSEDALAYFERKFSDLESHVRLLEQRVKAGVDAQNLKKSLLQLHADLKEPAAVGDLADLRTRATALDARVAELNEAKHEQTKEQVAEAIAKRNAIADKAFELAGQDVAKIQWKTTSAEFVALFEQWQQLQKDSVKVPKAEADPIWKKFSNARTKFEQAKRHHFAAQDAVSKAAKAGKLKLVEAAEALVGKDSDIVAEYRKLFDQWKTMGRAKSKGEEDLWLRFKAAGDAIYSAKAEVVAAQNTEFTANLEAKLALIAEAQKSVTPEKDLAVAKKTLQEIQSRWEKIGKVPKDKVRETEDKLRAIEAKVRKADEEHWRSTDPATQERTNSVLSQLEDAIAKLEADLSSAKAKKDAKAVAAATEALEARKAWLKVVQGK
ncbi:MAG: DUF349 domain-containing protein [Micrococcales bacterium]